MAAALSWGVPAALAQEVLAQKTVQTSSQKQNSGRELLVRDGNALMAALASAQGGETIRLAGGQYGELLLIPSRLPNRRFDPPVTLISADPANPAVFSKVDFREVAGMTLDGLVFDYRSVPGAKLFIKPFNITKSENITIRNSLFDGDVARGVNEFSDGYATGFGLSLRGGTNIVVEHNEIRGFYRGLVSGGIEGLVVRANNLHSIRMDGMNFSSVRDVLIENNYIHDFRRSPKAGDHADMIQFWTKGTRLATRNVTLRGNVLIAGRDGSTQSIFMRNEEVDSGRAGDELFYRNMLIEDNVIVNGHLHGITVGETDGLVIRSNTLLRLSLAAKGEDLNRVVRIPQIRVRGGSRNVTIADNLVSKWPEKGEGWTVKGNMAVQDRSATQPGYYHKLFVNAQSEPIDALESYVVRKGGPADRPGLGAPLTRPNGDRQAFRDLFGGEAP